AERRRAHAGGGDGRRDVHGRPPRAARRREASPRALPRRARRQLLRQSWQTLALLGAANVAHLQIDTSTIAIVDGDVGLVDFGGQRLRRARTRSRPTGSSCSSRRRSWPEAIAPSPPPWRRSAPTASPRCCPTCSRLHSPALSARR